MGGKNKEKSRIYITKKPIHLKLTSPIFYYRFLQKINPCEDFFSPQYILPKTRYKGHQRSHFLPLYLHQILDKRLGIPQGRAG